MPYLKGLMQHVPLTVDSILDHAAHWHADREVISRDATGTVTRMGYGELHRTAKRVSAALVDAGIKRSDRVATLGWNSAMHLAAWYGTTNIGAVLHTLNPRLFLQQLAYSVNQANDRILFADPSCAEIVARLLPLTPSIEHVIFLCSESAMPATPYPARSFDAFLAGHEHEPSWGGFDEDAACGLCYTSGTTGMPKGVLYSHRSNVLHTFMSLAADGLALTERDTVLLIVPMYHANAWGIVYSAPATGAKLVLPGPLLDGESVFALMESEGVTFSAAVPTVWQALLDHLRRTGSKPSALRRVVIGGSAPSPTMIRAFQDDYGVEVLQGWGMTETSPLATVSQPTAAVSKLKPDEQVERKAMQGRLLYGLRLRVEDEDGNAQPHDGTSTGRLKIAGHTVAAHYFGDEDGNIIDHRGYLDTGDVATVDTHGYLRITDRAKDMIKSGGEWISSAAIESVALAHPDVIGAAVIGTPHPTWDERPMLIAVRAEGSTIDAAELLAFLTGKMARWWLPDRIVFAPTLPLGATGKVDKQRLRRDLNVDLAATAVAPAT